MFFLDSYDDNYAKLSWMKPAYIQKADDLYTTEFADIVIEEKTEESKIGMSYQGLLWCIVQRPINSLVGLKHFPCFCENNEKKVYLILTS